MQTPKVRKNFLLDRDVIQKAEDIIKQKHKNLTEVINIYFQAIVKDLTILEKVESTASKHTGSFIGMLDGKIGDENMKINYKAKNGTQDKK